MITDRATSSDNVLQKLNWGKLEDRRRLHKVILVYKCLHVETEGANVNLIRYMDRHQHNTRRKEDFIRPKLKTEQLKRTFRYSAAHIWNSLPVDIPLMLLNELISIRFSVSINDFRKLMTTTEENTR